MSYAVEIHRESKGPSLVDEIRAKEKEFQKKPGVQLAIELIDLWKAFKNSVLRRSSSDLYAAAKVAYYREFLTDGVLLEDVFEPVEDDVFYAYRAKLGDGRWIGVDLDRLFTEMIRRKTDGRDDAVKLTLDRYGDIDVKALDCGTCPFVRDPYSCHLLHDKELCKGENRVLHDEDMQYAEHIQELARKVERVIAR